VVPSWAVTTTVPDPVTELACVITVVACDSVTVAAIVGIAVVPAGSTTLYVVVPVAKTGDKVPVLTVKELRVASVDAAAKLKVTVYVFWWFRPGQ
jgi:hypothetical protein